MTTAERTALVKELLQNGMHFVERTELHTPESCAAVERLLNRVLGTIGRSVRVTLDQLGMMVVLNPKGEPK